VRHLDIGLEAKDDEFAAPLAVVVVVAPVITSASKMSSAFAPSAFVSYRPLPIYARPIQAPDVDRQPRLS
jgi:hypothetical protein